MKKVILFTLAALMLMSGAAMATQSRIDALGRYTAPYICDDYNVFTWYATLPSYSNVLVMTTWNTEYYGEYDYSDGSDFGSYYAMTYGLGEDGDMGTLAMVFIDNMTGPNNDYWMAENINDDDWPHSDLADDDLYSKWILMYGYKMENMTFALMWSRASESWKDTEGDDEDESIEAYTTIGLGFRMEISDELTAEIAFDYTKVTDTRKGTDMLDREMDPNSGMALRTRGFYKWSDDITLVQYFSWDTKDFAMKENDEYTPYGSEGGYKAMNVTFGFGANMKVNDDNMILFAIEPYSMYKGEPSFYDEDNDDTWEAKYVAMPRFILALESDITDWLTFRTGMSKDLGKATWSGEDGDTSEEYEWTDVYDTFAWNLGLGFHFGDFDIDCVINKNVPFSMGYWLTGYQQDPYYTSNTPIAMISMLYSF
ncbi:MAG: hypothetical protein KOO63_07250 [Bacteroidales bacterium]|nr:hypothetical protein [Candidatus Latescibacterota bacterium]